MSGLGIEHFRSVGNLGFAGDRRLRLEGEEGQQHIEAPNRFGGALVTWFYGMKGVAEDAVKAEQNTAVREAFYQALVKGYGEEVANSVIAQNFGTTVGEFRKSELALTASTVKQVLDRADAAITSSSKGNHRSRVEFFDSSRFKEIAESAARGRGNLQLDPTDKELRASFYREVRQHPDYATRALSQNELAETAYRATERYCNTARQRFDEQYRGLAQLPSSNFHDATFFEATRRDLMRPPLSNAPDDFRLTAALTLDEIEGSAKDLAKMNFNPERAREIQAGLEVRLAALGALSEELEKTAMVGAGRSPARDLRNALLAEIDNQIAKLDAKITYLDEFRQNDPLSDKSVAYNKLVLAQSSQIVVQEEIAKLLDEHQQALRVGDHQLAAGIFGRIQDLDDAIGQHVRDATRDWENAGTDQRNVSTSKEFKIFGQHIPFVEPHPFRRQSIDEKAWLAQTLRDGGLATDGVGDRLKKARIGALDTIQEWHKIERDMVVSRDGVTRTYKSVITPGAKLDGPIGDSYQRDHLQGISAGNKIQSGHARNLSVSELYRTEPDGEQTLMSRTIRHGVLDSWEIKDPQERREASEAGAKEVLTTAVNMDKDFQARLRAKVDAELQNPQNPPRPSTLVHININLTTADTTVRNLGQLAPDYHEHTFTQNQFESFGKLRGTQEFDVGQGKKAKVDVDTITFSFGVNALALEENALAKISNPEDLWPPHIVEHNRQNMVKLFGDMQPLTRPGGYVGQVFDALQAKLDDPNTPAAKKTAVRETMREMQQDIDFVRIMFTNGDYKKGIDDAYKMVRHLESVAGHAQRALEAIDHHDTLFSLSEGCKSAKDREGMADVERKAQLIIRDMGGDLTPDESLSAQDQTIYNTVLTSSGQLEVQQYNTGLPGSKNAKELHNRINDPDAQRYAQGFSSFTKA